MQSKNQIEFKLLRPGAVLPTRGTPDSGAFDVYAPEEGYIEPFKRKLVPLGIAHQIPNDLDINLYDTDNIVEGPALMNNSLALTVPFKLQGLLISRSGLAAKHGVKLFMDPCLIDHDYRGEIKAIMYNASDETYVWKVGERLCQIAYVPFFAGNIVEVSELSVTDRGDGGFGSTGR